MPIRRPAKGISGGGFSTGTGLNVTISVDDSLISEFFDTVDKAAQSLGRMPVVVAGSKYGPSLVSILRATTPKGNSKHRGGHLANSWTQTEYEGASGSQVFIYNKQSDREDVLQGLELGFRSRIIKAKKQGARLAFLNQEGELRRPFFVKLKARKGRFFIRAVGKEADRRGRLYINEVFNSLREK